MVKILKRIINRRYKKKDHSYVRYQLEFPTKLNIKLSPHEGKTFEVDLKFEETKTEEILKFHLTRKKP